MNAPVRRAVPETKLRVASSVIAIVSVNPGKKTISPEGSTVNAFNSPMAKGSTTVSSAQVKPAIASINRLALR